MFYLYKNRPDLTQRLHSYIDRNLSLQGEKKYAYTVLSKQNPLKSLIISNYSDKWLNLYRANNFQLIDPVIQTAFKRISPFFWDEDLALKSAKIFSLSSRYDIVNGETFILHDQLNNLSLLSITLPDCEKNDLKECGASKRAAMQMMLIDINEQMYRLGKSASRSGKNNKPKREKAIFTQRENEVLYWAGMGKTYTDIAAITGISLSTVKFHMGNAVMKLGANNARHAIRLSTELGLIVPVA